MRAIIINPKDNVANALANISKGEKVKVRCDSEKMEIQVKQNIRFGHKFAIKSIKKGEKIVKYGEIIGQASRDIKIGEHVHVHNVESLRGRGDLNK